MREQLQPIESIQARSGFVFVFSCVPAAGLLVLLSVASLTSNQNFNALYHQVSDYLWLSKTSLSAWLLVHPGVGHVLGYALLSLALSGVLSRQRQFVAPLAALFFGVLMEGAQLFIPTRDASLVDIGADILGIAIGLGIYLLWVGKSKMNSGSSPG